LQVNDGPDRVYRAAESGTRCEPPMRTGDSSPRTPGSWSPGRPPEPQAECPLLTLRGQAISHLEFRKSKRSIYPQTPSTAPSAARTTTIATPRRREPLKSDSICGGSKSIVVIPSATQAFPVWCCFHVATLLTSPESSVSGPGSAVMGTVHRHAGCPSNRRFASGRFRACISRGRLANPSPRGRAEQRPRSRNRVSLFRTRFRPCDSELASGPAGFELLPRGGGHFTRFAYPRNPAKPPARKFTRLCISDEYQRYENEYDEERKNHRLPNRVGEL
jgi:hypothetical protein